MASKYWIKLYIELLDDPKMGMLPADVWRFAVELFLLAGELNCNGSLQNVTQISWRLRYSVTQVETWLKQLERDTGIVAQTEAGWVVTNFSKRQAASGVNERVKRHRERQKEQELKRTVTPVTVTPVTVLKQSNAPDIDTDIDTDIGSAAINRRPPAVLAYKIFVEETKKHCLNTPQIKVINDEVGDDPAALEKWREVVKAWNLNGNKLTDAAGMLDWYKTGKRSNYDPNKFKNSNGAPDPAPVSAPPLDDAKRAAYAAMLAADQQAAAESAARVGEIMANPTAGGVDVQRELKRVARRMK